jgi:predicted NBD/HSP70 family sugar kinase
MVKPAAARPDEIRRHNLALVLDQVHRDGTLTRAELTRRLELSRSTVGALVADLVELGLVTESVPSGNVRAGRPSHVVAPDPCGPFVIAVDLDVTRVTVAAVGLGGRVLGRAAVGWAEDCAPTPEEFAATVVRLVAQVEEPFMRGGASGVGVSVPGTVHADSGRIGLAPNLGWREVPLGRLLGEALQRDVEVRLGNDADLAVLAEHRRGSGRGIDDVVYLLGRVGVGAGIIVNGRLLRGRSGFVGEIGHNVMDENGPLCHCGKRGCLETLVGDAALLSYAGRGEPPTSDNVRAVFAAARDGDEHAVAAVRRVAAALGHAVAEIVNTIDPQRVIFGGSLSDVLDIAEPDVVDSMRRHVFAGGPAVELAVPALAADSPLLGAAEIAFESLLADPLSVR